MRITLNNRGNKNLPTLSEKIQKKNFEPVAANDFCNLNVLKKVEKRKEYKMLFTVNLFVPTLASIYKD